MSFMSNDLPWPRGQTASGRGLKTMTTSTFKELEGRLFYAPDDNHGTGRLVGLRVVRVLGADLAVARKLVSFSTAQARDYGSAIDGLAGTAGEFCKPLDDKYAIDGISTLSQNDLVYVIDSGPCRVSTNDACNIVAGKGVQNAGAGLSTLGATDKVWYGVGLETAAGANTPVLVEVFGGIHTGPVGAASVV